MTTGRRGSEPLLERARSRVSISTGPYPSAASHRICRANCPGVTVYRRNAGLGDGETSWYMRIGTARALSAMLYRTHGDEKLVIGIGIIELVRPEITGRQTLQKSRGREHVAVRFNP